MSIFQRKDRHGEWWIDLYDASGRRIRRKARTQSLEGAIEQERFIRAQLALGREKLNSFPLYGGSTFAEFAERWMTDYVRIANRPSTAEEKEYALRSRLLPAFGDLRLEEISTGLVDAQAANWIKSGLSVKRANNLLTIFRKALGCAVEWGLNDRLNVLNHVSFTRNDESGHRSQPTSVHRTLHPPLQALFSPPSERILEYPRDLSASIPLNAEPFH